MRKGGDQNQRKIGGREIKPSEELYGMFSVTLSMPKSQVFPALALLFLAGSLFTCSGFSAARQLPEASALHVGRGHPQFHFLWRISHKTKTSHSVASRPRGRYSFWEVPGLIEELCHSWGKTAARRDGHMCVCCSFNRFGGFLLLPALPVPAPTNSSSWTGSWIASLAAYEGTGLTFNEKLFFFFLFFFWKCISYCLLLQGQII